MPFIFYICQTDDITKMQCLFHLTESRKRALVIVQLFQSFQSWLHIANWDHSHDNNIRSLESRVNSNGIIMCGLRCSNTKITWMIIAHNVQLELKTLKWLHRLTTTDHVYCARLLHTQLLMAACQSGEWDRTHILCCSKLVYLPMRSYQSIMNHHIHIWCIQPYIIAREHFVLHS